MIKLSESAALAAVCKVCFVDYANHTIVYNPATGKVGNRTLGKLDYLHNFGWRSVASKSAVPSAPSVLRSTDNDSVARDKKIKREKKASEMAKNKKKAR